VFSKTWLLIAAGMALAAGCAPVSASPASGGSRHLIPEEEIAASTATNALDLVRRARPHWLRSRGQVSYQMQPELVVYVNGRPSGGAEALADFTLESIRELRYLSATEATQRFGTDHGAGAILVTLR
jgi:hypothetical protein